VRLYLGWRSALLLVRLTEDQVTNILARCYGIPITTVYLSRARRELRRMADAIEHSNWTPLRVRQPLAEVPPPMTASERNPRIGALRQNVNAAEAIRRRVGRLNDSQLRRSGKRGDERMAILERRALADEGITQALSNLAGTSSPAMPRDLLIAAIANYEIELEQRGD
jgi:hypothetical protein